MNTTTTRQDLVQRGSALALALVVTLALMAGIDTLATQDLHADALLAQQSAAAVMPS
jgi:phosphoribosylpyrophosphate synthetase